MNSAPRPDELLLGIALGAALTGDAKSLAALRSIPYHTFFGSKAASTIRTELGRENPSADAIRGALGLPPGESGNALDQVWAELQTMNLRIGAHVAAEKIMQLSHVAQAWGSAKTWNSDRDRRLLAASLADLLELMGGDP